MAYVSTSKKFYAILNKKYEVPTLMNALGHMSLGLSKQVEDTYGGAQLVDYVDKSGGSHGLISEHPYIILKAKNSNQLLALKKQLQGQFPVTNFTASMLGDSLQDQLDSTQGLETDEHEYIGLVTYGDTVELSVFLKKFSVMR